MSENCIKIAAGEDYSWLEGNWQSEDQDYSSVVVSILIDRSYPGGAVLRLTAVDRSDNEEFVIEDLSLSDGRIAFTTIMPSTGCTVRNEMEKSDTSDAVRIKLSYWERWTKVTT